MNVSQWIKEGSKYADGVALYENFKGHNKLLLKQFSSKKTTYLVEKLKHELLKLDKPVAASPIKLKKKKVLPKTNLDPQQLPEKIQEERVAISSEKKHKLLMHQLPAELRPLYEEAYSLFIKNCRLKVELNEMPPTINTYELQARMEANWKRNQWCWNQIGFWQENGVLPTVTPSEFEALTPAQLIKRQQLKWQQISKAEKYIELREKKLKAELPLKDRVKAETELRAKKEKLLQYEAEAIELKNRIDNG